MPEGQNWGSQAPPLRPYNEADMTDTFVFTDSGFPNGRRFGDDLADLAVIPEKDDETDAYVLLQIDRTANVAADPPEYDPWAAMDRALEDGAFGMS